MPVDEESPDDAETLIRRQCFRRRTCCLRGGECPGFEERRNVGRGKAQKLRRVRQGIIIDIMRQGHAGCPG